MHFTNLHNNKKNEPQGLPKTCTTRKRLHVRNSDKKLDKWVPHKLNEIANSFLPLKANELFINRIVACIEKWVNCGQSRWSRQLIEAGGTDLKARLSKFLNNLLKQEVL